MSQKKITVYSSDVDNHSISWHLRTIIKDFNQSHELGFRLFKRNLKAQYRQSMLGFGWAILHPLITACLWIFLNRSNVVSVADTGSSYPIFVITGTILWQVFTESILAPLTQISENKSILTKINIPREGLLLSGAYQLVFNTIIKILILVVIYLFFGETIRMPKLAFIPIGIFAISLTGFSIGLALTPLGMLYQDINRGLGILLPILMYLTPVVYPAPQDGTFGFLIKLNPVATLLTQTRNWFTNQPTYDMPLFWALTLFFGILFFLSLIIYRISMPMIIERIGT